MKFGSSLFALVAATAFALSPLTAAGPTKLTWAGGASWSRTSNTTSVQAGGPAMGGFARPSIFKFDNSTKAGFTLLGGGLSQPSPVVTTPLGTPSPVVSSPLGSSNPVVTTPLGSPTPVATTPLGSPTPVVNIPLAGYKTSGQSASVDSPSAMATSVHTTSGAIKAPPTSTRTTSSGISHAPVLIFPLGPELENLLWEIIFDLLQLAFGHGTHHGHQNVSGATGKPSTAVLGTHDGHKNVNGATAKTSTVVPVTHSGHLSVDGAHGKTSTIVPVTHGDHQKINGATEHNTTVVPVAHGGHSNGGKAILAAIGTMTAVGATMPIFVDSFLSAAGLWGFINTNVGLGPIADIADPISKILSPLRHIFSSGKVTKPLVTFHEVMERALQIGEITPNVVKGITDVARDTLEEVTSVLGDSIRDIAEESGMSASDIIEGIVEPLRESGNLDENSLQLVDNIVGEFSHAVEDSAGQVESDYTELTGQILEDFLARVNRNDLYDDPSTDFSVDSQHGEEMSEPSGDKKIDDGLPADQHRPTEEKEPASEDELEGDEKEEKPEEQKPEEKRPEEQRPEEERPEKERPEEDELDEEKPEQDMLEKEKSASDDELVDDDRPVMDKQLVEKEDYEDKGKEKLPVEEPTEEQELEPLGLKRKLLREIRRAEADAEERRRRFIEGEHFPEPPPWEDWQRNLQRIIRFEYNRERLNQLIDAKYRLADLRARWEAEWADAPEQGGGNLGKGKNPKAPWNNAPTLEARLELLKQKLDDPKITRVQSLRLRAQIRELEMQIQAKKDSEKTGKGGKPPMPSRRGLVEQMDLLDAAVSGLTELESIVEEIEFDVAASSSSPDISSTSATSDSISSTGDSTSSTIDVVSSTALASLSIGALSFPFSPTTTSSMMVESFITITRIATTTSISDPVPFSGVISATTPTPTSVDAVTVYDVTTIYAITTTTDVHTMWYAPYSGYAPGHQTRSVIPSAVPTPSKKLTLKQKYRLRAHDWEHYFKEAGKNPKTIANIRQTKEELLFLDWYLHAPPAAQCSNFYTILFLNVNITNVNYWAGRDNGARLWHEVRGCGVLTARHEQYDPITGFLYGISFYLPVLMKDGCVGRAIASAGGPHSPC